MSGAPTPAQIREDRLRLNRRQDLARKGWYHSMEFPDGAAIDGVLSLENLKHRYAAFPLPDDLTGKRVLDIGAWDGWFSFESERRGAQVTAVDCVEIENFLYARRKLSSQVDYRVIDLYELPQAGLGRFDYVLLLGVLYHVKHPLLALEIVCSLTTDLAIVECFVVDAATWREHQEEIPWMEFYETYELGGQLDNWVGPSVSCLLALCRAAGFARVELLGITDQHAAVACYRRWEPAPAPLLGPAPLLQSAVHSLNYGINFSSRRDEYLICWLRSPEAGLTRENLRPEVGGYGVPAIHLRNIEQDLWNTSLRLPPGLSPGWHPVRLRTVRSDFSNSVSIAVDLPVETDSLVVGYVCDGITWEQGMARAAEGGFLSFWIQGLAENCDRNNIRVYLGDSRLPVDFFSQPDGRGFRQVNARVPAGLPEGPHPLTVRFGNAVSQPLTVKIV